MKKLNTLLILVFLCPVFVMAQDDIKRPKNVGISDFDNFKNSSFDVREESGSLNEDVTKLDGEIKNYSGVMNTIGVAKLKEDLAALKGSKDAVAKLNDKIGDLDNEGKTLVQNAKQVKPKLKSVSATKNTNKSIKGLGLAKNDLTSVSSLLETDIKLLSDELKTRGEIIE